MITNNYNFPNYCFLNQTSIKGFGFLASSFGAGLGSLSFASLLPGFILSFTFPKEGKRSAEKPQATRLIGRELRGANLSLENKVIKLSNKEKKEIRKYLVS